jgi:hypothetical protein
MSRQQIGSIIGSVWTQILWMLNHTAFQRNILVVFFFFFWQPRHLVSGFLLQKCEYMFNLSFVSFCKCPNTHSIFASFLLASVQIHIGSSLHFFNKYSILFSFLQVCKYIYSIFPSFLFASVAIQYSIHMSFCCSALREEKLQWLTHPLCLHFKLSTRWKFYNNPLSIIYTLRSEFLRSHSN